METSFQNNKFEKLRNLLIVSAVLVLGSGILAYRSSKKKNPSLTVREFLSLDLKYLTTLAGMKILLVGMIGGFIFGFIDNAGLWFGMDALEPWFASKGITGNAAAGYGNTFSDGLGAFLGTFIGVIVSMESGVNLESTPIWANAIGVIVGCLVGVAFGQRFGGSL
jgi:hypothetical protein